MPGLDDRGSLLVVARDHQVLLTALAAEGQGVQPTFRFAGKDDLIVALDCAIGDGLGSRVDRPALGDELMQPEGEQRTLRRRVLGARPRKQRRPDRGRGQSRVFVGDLGQCVGGLGHGSRRTSDEPPGFRLLGHPEGVLDPRGEGVVGQRFVSRVKGGILGLCWPACTDRRAQLLRVGCAVRGGPDQRLGDDMVREDLSPEDPARDLGHIKLLLGDCPPAGHSRRCADALKCLVSPARLPHAANQHPHIGALPATIGVQLVQDEELEALRRFDQ